MKNKKKNIFAFWQFFAREFPVPAIQSYGGIRVGFLNNVVNSKIWIIWIPRDLLASSWFAVVRVIWISRWIYCTMKNALVQRYRTNFAQRETLSWILDKAGHSNLKQLINNLRILLFPIWSKIESMLVYKSEFLHEKSLEQLLVIQGKSSLEKHIYIYSYTHIYVCTSIYLYRISSNARSVPLKTRSYAWKGTARACMQVYIRSVILACSELLHGAFTLYESHAGTFMFQFRLHSLFCLDSFSICRNVNVDILLSS